MNQMQIYLPPPLDWQDLQRLMKEIAEIRYVPGTVVEYGRPGQKQNGVDIYAEDRLGNRIGIQCKETKNNISNATIDAEAKEAKNFCKPLDLFIVATTARTDKNIQDFVIDINEKKIFPFIVKVEFWDQIVNDINRYAKVVNSCYSQYQAKLKSDEERNHLECVRIAFDRPAFTDDFRYERNYQDFEDALVATKRFFRTGFVDDRWLKVQVVQTIPMDFLPDGPYRKLISKIVGKLENLYNKYLTAKLRLNSSPKHADDMSGTFNILRRELLEILNQKLQSLGLDTIDYAYRDN